LRRCRDVNAFALAIEDDDASINAKQAVILGAFDIAAGVVARAALPDQNAAGRDRFAAVRFDA